MDDMRVMGLAGDATAPVVPGLIVNHKPGLYDQIPDDFKVRFLEHCKQTNRPETFPGLFYGRIDRNEPFTKIGNVPDISKARTADDRIPCPICFQRSKYASDGHLVYFHQIRRIAAIGPECANALNLLRADSEYKATEELRRNEDYLRLMLPRTPGWSAQISGAKKAVELAKSLSSEFNKQAKETRNRLKRASAGDGWLRADILDENKEYQRITIGRLTGLAALSGQLNARRLLMEAEALIAKHRCGKDAEAVEARLLELTQSNAVNQAAKDIQKAIRRYDAFVLEMKDFCSFFTPGNLDIANQWANTLPPAQKFTFRLTQNGADTTIAILSPTEPARMTTYLGMWQFADSLVGSGD